MIETTRQPTPAEVRAAVEDVFAARAAEAESTGGTQRTWPARLTAHPHWGPSFERAAESAGIDVTLVETVAQVNAWLERLEQA